MKTIEVNKFCEINQENIAPSVKNRDIAINIVQKEKDEKGFINFCLAIDNWQQCSEYFGVYFEKLREYVDNNVYVSKIETYRKLRDDEDWEEFTKKELEPYLKPSMGFFWEEGGYCLAKVYGKNKELLAIAYVYNNHNGYYWHNVYAISNGDIVYESFI